MDGQLICTTAKWRGPLRLVYDDAARKENA
jgi:hypothetical protein